MVFAGARKRKEEAIDSGARRRKEAIDSDLPGEPKSGMLARKRAF